MDLISAPIIETSYGAIQGRVTENHFYSFQGIPYAKPPIGECRFKDPQKPEPWSGVYNATYERSPCAQIDTLNQNSFMGSEDCLFLNIFTPKNLTMLLPVMVWIHGGGFFAGSGSSDTFNPTHLLQENVIVITFNYRLGVLGFLCLENEAVPGNAGLKDMVMALRWIRDNISKFGGDPDNVTIFGESAGGAAVQFLMISESGSKYFNKAISQSGSALNQWAYTIKNNDNPKQNAIDLCNASGYRNTDNILKHLQSLDVKDLVTISHKLPTYEDKKKDSAFTFAPVVENIYDSVVSFLNRSANDLMKNGPIKKIPYITGFNSKEAILWMLSINSDVNYLKEYNENFQYFVPMDLNYAKNSIESIQIADRIKQFYFGDSELCNATMSTFLDLMADNAFVREIVSSSKLLSKHLSPIFMYRFSFDGDLNYFKKKFNINTPGTSHEDDLGYIFSPKVLNSEKINNISKTMRKRMVTMWTNFAKYSQPTPTTSDLLPVEWKPIITENIEYLEINENMLMKSKPEEHRMKFWKQIYLDYKR